jgi:uncharacterized membrane protein YqiK
MSQFPIVVGAILILLALVALFAPRIVLGLVIISERQVGIVIKRLSSTTLPPGQLVALNGEAGYQADTLPPGWHLGYWPWMYTVHKVPVTVVPQGEIALVVAADGAPIPPERILGRMVDCDNFQNARKFLVKGGEKGRQLGILTAGTYRINVALFEVITADNSINHGMIPDQLEVYRVQADAVGIVTTLDGQPIEPGEIAGPIIPDHDNFQNAQVFLDGGGRRGHPPRRLRPAGGHDPRGARHARRAPRQEAGPRAEGG